MMGQSVVVLAALLVALCAAQSDEHLQVVTSKGVVQGRYFNSRGGNKFLAFQGIPYVKPALGELRFKPSQPADPWTGVLNATKDSPICIQKNVYFGGVDIEGDEDCLYLNVYTPQLPDKESKILPRTVMVWIHGGGWLSGGGVMGFYSPAYLMDRDVVLVTFNYRLGPLGFLSTGDKVLPGNNGLKDQVMALRWVRDNIAAFGGNPNSVTIFGQSAGGVSVHHQVLSPMSRGLFHRAISMSGSAFCQWGLAPGGNSRHVTERTAALLDCPTDSSEDMVACLRGKSATDIIATGAAFEEWDWHPHIPYRPVLEPDVAEGEEAFLVREPRETVKRKDYAAVPWMTGFTSGDGALLAVGIFQNEKLLDDLNEDFDRVVPISLFYRNTSNSVGEITKKIREFYFGENPIDSNAVYAVVDMYTDGFFAAGQDEAIKAHAAAGVAPAYYYVFDHRGTNTYASFVGDAALFDYGVSHGDDLFYLFPFGHFFPGVMPSEDDEKVVDIFTTLFSNYAKFGDPTPVVTELLPELWPPVTPSVTNYYHISTDVYASTDLYKARFDFWASLPIRDKYSASARDEL